MKNKSSGRVNNRKVLGKKGTNVKFFNKLKHGTKVKVIKSSPWVLSRTLSYISMPTNGLTITKLRLREDLGNSHDRAFTWSIFNEDYIKLVYV